MGFSSAPTIPPSLPRKLPVDPTQRPLPPVDKPTNEGPTTRYTLVFARGPSSHLAPCSATRRDWVGPRCLGLIRPGGTLFSSLLPAAHTARVPSPSCNPLPLATSPPSPRPGATDGQRPPRIYHDAVAAARRPPISQSPSVVFTTRHVERTPDSRPPETLAASRSCGLAPGTQKPR